MSRVSRGKYRKFRTRNEEDQVGQRKLRFAMQIGSKLREIKLKLYKPIAQQIKPAK